VTARWILFAAHQSATSKLSFLLDSSDSSIEEVGLRDTVVQDVSLFVIEDAPFGAPS
jgi:hypothetical protein